MPNEFYQVVENKIVENSTSKDRYIQNDEYDTDTDDIVSDIEKVNQVMIRILLAGASKSHICQKMVDNGCTILFVWPTNRLSQYFEVDTRKINNNICWSKFSLAASLLLASILLFLKLEHVMQDQLFHYRLHILCVRGPNIVKNTQKH